MQKMKLVICITAFLLLTSIFAFPAFSSQPPVDTTTYYIGTISQLRNVDPALAYDTASGELIHNIAEPLIWYGAGHIYLPAETSKVNSSDYSDKSYGGMLPYLAKYMPLVEKNTPPETHFGSNWTFQINTDKVYQDWVDPVGVVHSGQKVTADDVVYHFQRMLLFDSFESPSYLIGTPMFGSTGWFDGDPMFDADPDTVGIQPLNTNGAGERKASAAIQSHIVKTSPTNVTLYFELDYPAGGIAQILAQTWGCIEPKDFSIAHGCWNGTFYDGWSTDDPDIGVSNYPSSAASPLDTHSPHSQYASSSAEPAICGTGPYKLTYWDQAAQQWRADKFDNYWGGWAGNHVNTIIETGVDPWPTRKMMFLQGEFDSCVVNTANMYDLLDPSAGAMQKYTPIAGINLYYGQTTLVNAAFLINQNMSATGKFVPKVNGVPKPDLFSDIHVRRAFASAVNFSNFISGAYYGEAVHPASWWIDGFGTTLDYENKTLVAWDYNRALIIAEFAAAGITSLDITLTYNSGNVGRQIYCESLRDGLKEAMGAQFTVNVLAEDWGTFLTDQHAGNLPCWNVGWQADFADPDNFARPYMHSQGTFSGACNVDTDLGGTISAQVDDLLDYAISLPDGQTRNETYQTLQSIYHDRVWGVITVQTTGRTWLRDWVRNFEINQLYPGIYAYNRYKTAGGALQNVDIDVTHTITPVVSWPTVYVWKSKMTIGYQGVGPGASGSKAVYVYQIKVSRSDANSGLPLLATVVGIRRDNLTTSPAEKFAYPNSTTVLLGPSSSSTITLWWSEVTGSSTGGILPSSKTGVTWQIGARGDIAQAGAQDTNATNNYQTDGTVVAYSGLTGEINGDGIVDILDAITLAGVYGTQAGQARYNADANLNATPDPVSLKQVIDILDAITLANNFGKHIQP